MSVQEQALKQLDVHSLQQLERNSAISEGEWAIAVHEIAERRVNRFSCPLCNSPETQRLSVIYSESSESRGQSPFAGPGVAGGLGIGKGEFFAGRQSILAAKAAPPAPRSLDLFHYFVSVASWLIAAFLFERLNVGPWILWVGASSVAILVGYVVPRPKQKWNETSLPALRAEWERKFMCKRCGEIFTPGGEVFRP
jgi:hypothetical protein